MRTDPRRVASVAVVAFFALAAAGTALAQTPGPAADEGTGHGVRGTASPVLEIEEETVLARYKSLLGRLICACPDENWTRTLANCRDACADPQKRIVLARIREGWDDERILAEQVEMKGTFVLANPGWEGAGKWLFILPAAALVAGAAIAGHALRRSRQTGEAARAARRERREDVPPETLARIERDLESIE